MSNITNIRISSPGKIILHGEHSVVYMKPALAAVVGLRTFLYLQQRPGHHAIVFHLDSLDCAFEIKLSEINNIVERYTDQRSPHFNRDLLLEEVQQFVGQKHSSESVVKVKTLQAIYHLFCGCLITAMDQSLSQGYDIRLTSDISIGAGLGSSASFGVVIAAAALIITNQINLENYKEEESLALVSSWALESEKIMHGNPSGVDNTVCTYGGIVRFSKGQSFIKIHLPHPLNVLLVDSKVPRSTANLVAKVAALRSTFPKLVDLIWDAIEEIVNTSVPLYETLGDKTNDDKFNRLEKLFQINNDLLKAIGVSEERLERIFALANKNKFSCKLTGAGGGGYAVVLLPNSFRDKEEFASLTKELLEDGFDISQTTVGGEGLLIELNN